MTHTRSLVRTWVIALLATSLVSSLLIGGWMGYVLRRFHLDRAAEHLQTDARFLASLWISDRFQEPNASSAKELVKVAREIAPNVRVTLIAPDGAVWADSAADAERMVNHRGRPEVAEALEGRPGRATRVSDTTRLRTLYVAVPVQPGRSGGPVIRAAMSVEHVESEIRRLRRHIVAWVVALGIVCSASAILLGAALWTPLNQIARTARRLAAGQLDQRAEIPAWRELSELAEAINDMAQELEHRIRLSEERQYEMETLLNSMTEGVVAVDANGRVRFLNQPAAEQLGLHRAFGHGADYREVVRLAPLQQLLADTLQRQQSSQTEIVHTDGERRRYLLARATPIRGANGALNGAVMVLNDTTELHRLLNVRREFFANASHELRSPLTSIRGFLETLLDPNPPPPDEQQKFLHIALRQTRRLQTLVDDLLELTRLEQAPSDSLIHRARLSAAQVVRDVVELYAMPIQAKALRVETVVPEQLEFMADRELIIRALGNILDNAIRYSPDGGRIRIECRPVHNSVEVAVVDEGPGIEARHLPRLFERFYRVDKSRSRREGGTGLGLAIVKHIVLLHGGQVGVESEPGRGSRFWFRIPTGLPTESPEGA